MLKYLALCITALALPALLFSQDKIFQHNKQIIEAKIVSIGLDEIVYKPYDNLNGPTYSIAKDKVAKIVFENGKMEVFKTNNLLEEDLYFGQLTKAFKVDFLGPLLGYTQFIYEKNLGKNRSVEWSLGVIGAGKANRLSYYSANGNFVEEGRKPFGISVGAAYKFNKIPDLIFGRAKFAHLMQGSYARPSFYLGNYSENTIQYKANNQYVVERLNTTFAALQLEFGRQWIFADKFLLDTYWGLGYGFDNKRNKGDFYDDYEYAAFNYINTRVGRTPGLSFTFGVRTGLLLK